jgi:RNA ligase (TIGR02306 family)
MVYIEPDTNVPLDRQEFKFLDDGKGKTHMRITMRRFRGEASYGLLIPAPQGSVEGDNLWDALGVERWEPKTSRGHGFGPTGMQSGLCAKGPTFHVPEYGLENWKKFHKYLPEGEEVIYTVKIHGSSARFVYSKESEEVDGEMFCGSRTTWKMKPGTFIKTIELTDPETGVETPKDILAPENAWWTAFQQNPWIEKWCMAHPNTVLYGEIFGGGVQGQYFKYGKEQGQVGFAAFDVLEGGKWVNNAELFDNPIYSEGMEETVRVVYRGPHDSELLKKLSEETDESIYPGQKIREGIVLKTVTERTHSKFGRLALKNVSDNYLMMK